MGDSRPSVAFVEDDLEFCEAVVAFFGLCGLATRAFATADEAMRSFEESPVDVLVTDLNLGSGAGGRELARRVREREPTRRMRIVCLTGEPSALVDDEGLFDAMLLKPIDMDVLVEKVRELLATRAS